eukprot:5433365-Prymnesium_polylepis.1
MVALQLARTLGLECAEMFAQVDVNAAARGFWAHRCGAEESDAAAQLRTELTAWDSSRAKVYTGASAML